MDVAEIRRLIAEAYGIPETVAAQWAREAELQRLHRALWRLRIRRHWNELANDLTERLLRP